MRLGRRNFAEQKPLEWKGEEHNICTLILLYCLSKILFFLLEKSPKQYKYLIVG